MHKRMSKLFPGFTLMVVFGSYGGFHIRYAEDTLGICLGWMAITCYFYDYEDALKVLIDKKDESK